MNAYMNQSIEIIEVTSINPLISKGIVKVCYVSDDPNRNGSIIDEETGRFLAQSIPGSPVVGYYNEDKEDFEGHNRIIDISNGQFKIKETTRPYGFVDINAKVWFQTMPDRNGIPRKYLMTEAYLWTGQYPECQRVIDKENGQSMELDDLSVKGTWTKDKKGAPEFFIINEAIMSKLCILGDGVEPCFEGAGFAPEFKFSFDEDLKQSWFSFMNQMKEILKEGGKPVFNKYNVNIGDALWTALFSYAGEEHIIAGVYENEGNLFAVLKSHDKDTYYRLDFSFENDVFTPAGELTDITESFNIEDVQFSLEDTLTFKKKKEEEEEDKEDKSKDPKKEEKKEEKSEEEESEDDEDEDEDEFGCSKNKKKKSAKFSALAADFEELQTKYNTLNTTYEALKAENAELLKFKAGVEREQKMNMINVDFCMLDEDLKKDVIDNVDKYSLDEIEAKLSIICVRNKVNFNLETSTQQQQTTFSLDDVDNQDAGIPAWILAAREVAKTMND